ncbi:Ig-like domain-containing protein, partial [Aeromonas hydrophila]
MNFAFLTDKDAFYHFPLNEQENAFVPVQAVEGARYVFTEQAESDIRQTVFAERVEDDLYLRLRSESEPSAMVQVKDFFLHQGCVTSLSQSGEYHLHLAADSSIPAGPVELSCDSLGTQEAQPEAAHLKVAQQTMTFQALDKLAETLNPTAETAPEVAVAEAAHFMAVQPALAPLSPSITELHDDVGVNQGILKSGGVTDDNQPKLVGLGVPNSTLDILLNGLVIDSVLVDAQGNWSYIPDAPLKQGGQLFFVRDQETGKASGNVVLIIDTVAPSRASVDTITDDLSGTPSNIAKEGFTRDITPTLAGTAEPNTLVIIYNNNTPIKSIYSDMMGNWSWTPMSLPDGTYVFTAAAMDFSGNIGMSSKSYTITVDGRAPNKPIIVTATDDVGTAIDNIDGVTNDSTPTLVGKAEAGSTVTIKHGDVVLGTTKADNSGNWSFTLTDALTEGKHGFTVTATDAAGNTSVVSDTYTITIDTSIDKPTIDAITDNVGVKQGELGAGAVTDDQQPTLSGTA